MVMTLMGSEVFLATPVITLHLHHKTATDIYMSLEKLEYQGKKIKNFEHPIDIIQIDTV